MTTVKKALWTDIPCPTCYAGVNQGCLVFGFDTLMKVRLHPHKRRVKEAEKVRTSGK